VGNNASSGLGSEAAYCSRDETLGAELNSEERPTEIPEVEINAPRKSYEEIESLSNSHTTFIKR